MFKIVTSNENLLRRLNPKGFLARVVQGDLRLLSCTQDPRLANRLVESLWVDRAAVSKETAPGRFRDLDGLLSNRLRHVPHPVIHDVAVSDGLTSLDLLRQLRSDGLSPTLYISDMFSRCLHLQNGFLARAYDTHATLLWGRVGFILADPKASWRFPLSRFLFYVLKHLPPMDDTTVTDIILYNPAVRAALDSRDLTHLDYDVFLGSTDVRFDLVRCMNIITRRYFPPDRIGQAVATLRTSLKPAGLLLVGRTLPGGRNDATLFRLEHGRLVPERVINAGADIHDIVVALPPA